jgi:hypothetical protein
MTSAAPVSIVVVERPTRHAFARLEWLEISSLFGQVLKECRNRLTSTEHFERQAIGNVNAAT